MSDVYVDAIQSASGKHTARVYVILPNGCYFIREHWVFDETQEGMFKAQRKADKVARAKGYTLLKGFSEIVVFT